MSGDVVVWLVGVAAALTLAIQPLRHRSTSWRSLFTMMAAWAVIFVAAAWIINVLHLH